MMKKLLLLSILLAFSFVNAQFKNDLNKPIDVKSGMLNKNSFSILGLVGVEDFQMHHSFGLSYSMFAGNGISLGTYTNSMFLKFNDRLNLMADISIVNSPYNSLGKDFSKQINGVYIDRLQMNYKISDGMSLMVQYSNSPYNYYSNYSMGGYSSFWGDSFFSQNHFGKQ
jgi:hypothetical protein